MISDSGRSKRPARPSSSPGPAAKWRALKRPVFGSTRASAWSCGTVSERWIRTSGASDERDQPRVQVPERGDRDAERADHELCGEALEREEPGLPERVVARELEHRREQNVVDADQHDGGCEARDRKPEIARPGDGGVLDEVRDPPRSQRGERVVAHVERLDVPAVANLQPLRYVLDDAHRAPRAPAGAGSRPGSGKRGRGGSSGRAARARRRAARRRRAPRGRGTSASRVCCASSRGAERRSPLPGR